MGADRILGRKFSSTCNRQHVPDLMVSGKLPDESQPNTEGEEKGPGCPARTFLYGSRSLQTISNLVGGKNQESMDQTGDQGMGAPMSTSCSCAVGLSGAMNWGSNAAISRKFSG